MNDIYILNKILIKIKEKHGYPDFLEWNNSIFSDLSEKIFEKTSVLLSRNTLKYLVQKVVEQNQSYSPQQITKQALCIYIGYDSWDDFRAQLLDENSHIASEETVIVPDKKKPFVLKKYINVGVVSFFAAALIIIWILLRFIPTDNTNQNEFSFIVSDSAGVAPHTISVKYDFSKNIKDTFLLDFDCFSAAGKYELKKFYRKNGVENFCFYHPGYYHCALYCGDNLIRRFHVFIESDNWNAFVWNATLTPTSLPKVVQLNKDESMRHIPFDNYITQPFCNNGQMNVSKSLARSVPGITKNYNTTFQFFRRFNLSGDDFRFKVNFSNPYYGEDSFCYSAKFEIICTNGKHYYQIMNHGCHLYAKYGFSEVEKNGITANIDGFEHDFSRPRVIECININKNITLQMDENPFHRNSYSEPVGEIVGIRMTFKSAPVITSVELSDKDGNVVFIDNFK